MKNSYHKAFVPSRRVNYYKHVKFDLRDNITSRDATKENGFVCRTARTRCSGNSPQNPVLKTSRNGYLDLRRTREKKIVVLVNEFDQAFRLSTKPHRKSKSKSLGLSSKRHDTCKISHCPWIWMTATSPFLAARYERFAGLRLLIIIKIKHRKKRTPTSKKN